MTGDSFTNLLKWELKWGRQTPSARPRDESMFDRGQSLNSIKLTREMILLDRLQRQLLQLDPSILDGQ